MDIFPKFIIETDDDYGNCLILSKCTYHRELVTNRENVKGGGIFRYDSENNTFILSGSSHEFGRSSFEDIKECIENGNIFTNSSLAFPITEKHKFSYDSGSEIISIK